VLNFFVFFIHKLFKKWLQFMGLGLHNLLMLESLLEKGRICFINTKTSLNNNNNNILLLLHSYIYV
jgi:hypothetical protein